MCYIKANHGSSYIPSYPFAVHLLAAYGGWCWEQSISHLSKYKIHGEIFKFFIYNIDSILGLYAVSSSELGGRGFIEPGEKGLCIAG